MRLVLRLISLLVICLLLVSVFSSYYQIKQEKRSFRSELEKRAEVFAESLEQNIETLLAANATAPISRTVERFGRNNNHLVGVAVFKHQQTPAIAISSSLASKIPDELPLVARAMAENRRLGQFTRMDGKSVHFCADPLHNEDGKVIGGLLVVHDASYITASTWRAWRETSVRLGVQVCLVTLITLLVFQRSVMRPISRTTAWMRELRHGRTPEGTPPSAEIFGALTHEAAFFAKTLADARASAEREARLRDSAESSWTAERLAVCLQTKLKGSRLFVVANREPYMHMRDGRSIKTIVPASGLVTGLEPILRACDGTWVAHGSGSADRETVDRRNRLRVPPENPRYSLRRVWLNKEQEKGYYLGFSNEGLWPLCHIAHTRPTFRAADWEQYKAVNALFAEAVLEEMADTEQPVVIVQDYHFALLPKLIRERRPDARVGIFWHIPWPNSEAFGICPWQNELLQGMLGADLIGFHVQAHCDNFLETVNAALEARIEWERFAVCQRGHSTVVRPFPISVDFPDSAESSSSHTFHVHQATLLKEIGADALYIGVGVDRVDYTKGILERFLAVERFLEKYPQYQGKFSFIQIGAPSRTDVKRYHDFLIEVEQECERINRRFTSGNWRPILFRKWHHNHAEVERFYRAADVCLVTSLHDGMNLVAKEFLVSRTDEDGALILSPFTGAARELTDAFIVNPYDTESVADAIFRAIEMDPAQRKTRMRHMRSVVKQQNVYRWAGTLIGELCEVRLSHARSFRHKELAHAAVAGQAAGPQQVMYDLNNAGAISASGD
ncbi:MAG TPA: trehalose-6-phosphate synthase [Terriglobales bacterium]|nr:trehalose-6-phosphate synthase [Terriglobales bacterium]